MVLATVALCLVVGVTDGDTLTARCPTKDAVHHYQQIKVRLAEIDAPETGQAFGRRSKQKLSELCFNVPAKIRPTNKDRYGRTVARVECNGRDANLEMVKTGMAWAYTKYQTDPAFPKAQEQARRDAIGLWRDPHAIPPWEYRRQSVPARMDEKGCYVGPRGGRYKILNGKKRYDTC